MLQKEKENRYTPKKQGVLYSISTGKNNGVYLPKDISSGNHKSLKLLTKQAIQSHKSYVDTLNLIANQKQAENKDYINLYEVQSFGQNYTFDIKHTEILHTNLSASTSQIKILTTQLKQLTTKITTQHSLLFDSALPALKSLKQKIKQNKQQQIATYYKINRELEKIQQCFQVVSGGIKECYRKIQGCQQRYKGKDYFSQ